MTDPLAEKIGINVQGGTVNVQNLNIGIAERLAQSGDRVRILVVAANPLGSSPLQLDREVKTIQDALRRSRKRDNFVVEYRLAATPSELRRALLDLEPHVLHFSGHGAGEQGLLFVSDESMGSLHRSDYGAVRSRSSDTDEIKFVSAQPLAHLLKLCEDHLECVVLNACYSDVQGNAISANIPFTIGMRDQVADSVAIKFSQGFYDAIGAGKSYESAFKWGKVAIEFDLADAEAANILILRKKGELFSHAISNSDLNQQRKQQSETERQRQIDYEQLDTYFKGREFFQQGLSKQNNGDNDGAIDEYSKALQIEPDLAEAYYNRAIAKKLLEDDVGSLKDFSKAIAILPELAEMFISHPNVYINLEEKYKGILYFDHKNHEYLVDAYNNLLIQRIERISNNFNP